MMGSPLTLVGTCLLKIPEHVDADVEIGYMNQTTYNVDTTIASVQPGARWGAVYEALDPYGVTAAGGRADVVGVGGFITGGGYSFHAGTMGWACDAVENFEVVLGNGSVVNANDNEHADLFQALKGSSGNLGLLTRVDLCKFIGSLGANFRVKILISEPFQTQLIRPRSGAATSHMTGLTVLPFLMHIIISPRTSIMTQRAKLSFHWVTQKAILPCGQS